MDRGGLLKSSLSEDDILLYGRLSCTRCSEEDSLKAFSSSYTISKVSLSSTITLGLEDLIRAMSDLSLLCDYLERFLLSESVISLAIV